jgi:hypothetical protein
MGHIGLVFVLVPVIVAVILNFAGGLQPPTQQWD